MLVNLSRHLEVFNAVLFSDRFHGVKNRAIKRQVYVLCRFLHGSDFEYDPDFTGGYYINITKEYVVDELFFNYWEKGHYKKYDDTYSLSTWVEQYIYRNLSNLLRKHRPRSIEEGINGWSDLCDPDNSNFRLSYEEFQGWMDMAATPENPETLLQYKELLHLAMDHFGRENLKVILGVESKLRAIKRRNLNYDQYTKRLYRMKQSFLRVAGREGYECY